MGNDSRDQPSEARAVANNPGRANRQRRPKRQAVLTEQIVLRIDKQTLIDLEDFQMEHQLLSLGEAVRRTVRLGLAGQSREGTRRFEETP